MKQMSTAILHMHCSQGSGLSLTSLLTRNLLCALTGRCRCCFGCAEDRPNPTVQAEADDPEAQLQLDPDAWQHKWDNTQAGGDVCLYKLWLAGPPGPVKLVVRCGPHKRCVSLHCLHGRLLVHGFTMLAELHGLKVDGKCAAPLTSTHLLLAWLCLVSAHADPIAQP